MIKELNEQIKEIYDKIKKPWSSFFDIKRGMKKIKELQNNINLLNKKHAKQHRSNPRHIRASY